MTENLQTRKEFEAAMAADGWTYHPPLLEAGGMWMHTSRIGDVVLLDDEAYDYWQEHGAVYQPPPF